MRRVSKAFYGDPQVHRDGLADRDAVLSPGSRAERWREPIRKGCSLCPMPETMGLSHPEELRIKQIEAMQHQLGHPWRRDQWRPGAKCQGCGSEESDVPLPTTGLPLAGQESWPEKRGDISSTSSTAPSACASFLFGTTSRRPSCCDGIAVDETATQDELYVKEPDGGFQIINAE